MPGMRERKPGRRRLKASPESRPSTIGHRSHDDDDDEEEEEENEAASQAVRLVGALTTLQQEGKPPQRV